jgi:uncharacterized DUF497 family protein
VSVSLWRRRARIDPGVDRRELAGIETLASCAADRADARYNMLAVCEGRVFHITYTRRGELTWIISARRANRREQRRYAARLKCARS